MNALGWCDPVAVCIPAEGLSCAICQRPLGRIEGGDGRLVHMTMASLAPRLRRPLLTNHFSHPAARPLELSECLEPWDLLYESPDIRHGYADLDLTP